MSFKFIYSMSLSLKVAIVGWFIYYIFIIIAILNFPEYNFFTMTLSKLGAHESSSFFFSVGTLIAVVTMIYIMFILSPTISNLFKKQIHEFKIILIIFSIMLLCLIGVVIFPSMGNTATIHYIIAVTLFIMMAFGTAWTSKLAAQEIPSWNSNISNLGYLCSISVVILAFLLWFWEYGPFIQKTTIFLFNSWVVGITYGFQNSVNP